MIFNTILLIAFQMICVKSFFTDVPTGYIGVYSILNEIQDKPLTTFSWFVPMYSKVTLVKYIQDSDYIEDTRCVTVEGVETVVPRIEIANEIKPDYLIKIVKLYGFNYDKVLVVNPLAQRIREICASRTVDELTQSGFHELDDMLKTWTQAENDNLGTGIKINYVRLSQLTIPKELKDKKLALAEEKANKILAEEKIKRVKTEKESEMFIAQRNSEIKAAEATKNNEIMISNMKAKQQEQYIQNEMIVASAIANAEKIREEARALMEMYAIPDYANVKKVEALSQNQKIYYGDRLPINFPLLQQN